MRTKKFCSVCKKELGTRHARSIERCEEHEFE